MAEAARRGRQARRARRRARDRQGYRGAAGSGRWRLGGAESPGRHRRARRRRNRQARPQRYAQSDGQQGSRRGSRERSDPGSGGRSPGTRCGSAPAPSAPATAAEVHTGPADPPRITNSPAQRQWRREHGVDPAATLFSQPASKPAEVAKPAPVEIREEVPMSPLRRRIAERLVEAQHTAAILTTFNEVDMSYHHGAAGQVPGRLRQKHGIKLGFMSFFAAACARALIEFPGLNAEVRPHETASPSSTRNTMTSASLSVAVRGWWCRCCAASTSSASPRSKGHRRASRQSQRQQAHLPELQGGTFSISNGGIYGSMMSTPLLNLPQTGILGMHNIVRRPIVVGSGESEKIEIRPMMYIALSYDHRVVDGREAVSFLVKVKDRLENPRRCCSRSAATSFLLAPPARSACSPSPLPAQPESMFQR